jgi:hypothetical protein
MDDDRGEPLHRGGQGVPTRTIPATAGSTAISRSARASRNPEDCGGLRASTNCSTMMLLIRRNRQGPPRQKEALLHRLTIACGLAAVLTGGYVPGGTVWLIPGALCLAKGLRGR